MLPKPKNKIFECGEGAFKNTNVILNCIDSAHFVGPSQ
jgi:hypothetical protein